MSNIRHYVNLVLIIMSCFKNLTVIDSNMSINKKLGTATDPPTNPELSKMSLKSLTVQLPTNSAKFSNHKEHKNVCFPDEPPKYKFSSDWDDCEKEAANIIGKSTHYLHGKNTTEILEIYGYSSETHLVKTEDGYILTLFRVTKRSGKPNSGLPVYLNHGMGGSSDNWFFVQKEKSIVTKLMQNGYDVWLSNARGTPNSLGHETLDFEIDLDYWDFSFHEMAICDLPAVTNHIIENSNYKNILYVAVSMGTTQALIALSEIPEMNEKIQAAFLLAPIAYLGHATSNGRVLGNALHSYAAYKMINQKLRGRSNSSQLNEVLGDVCSYTTAKCGLCDNAWLAYFGYNAPQMNRTELPNVLARIPKTISDKTLSHYGQFINSCNFHKYDYGRALNLEEYGSENPPEYKLENIKSDIYFYYSSNDNIGVPLDVNITAEKLDRDALKEMYLVPDKWFTHVDFGMAKDVDKLVYNKVLNDMKKYQ